MSVVDTDSLSRFGRFILMSGSKHPVVSGVFPLLIEFKEAFEELLELTAVFIDGIHIHQLPHIRASRRISDHAGSSAQQHHRGMAKFLHIHHDDDLHEMTHMQAVRRGIESDVEFDLFPSQKTANRIFIGDLLDEAALLQNVIDVIILADVIRYKIFHLKSTLLINVVLFLTLFRTACPRRLRGPARCRRSRPASHPWTRCRYRYRGAPSAASRFPAAPRSGT